MKEDAQLICPIGYDDPCNLWRVHNISARLRDFLPLRNVTWKNPVTSTFLSTNLPIRFIPLSSSLFKDTDHPYRWFLAPYLNIYIAAAATLEDYKDEVKPIIKQWIDSLNSARKVSWIVVYIPYASQSVDSYSKIYTKICGDFFIERSGDRSVLLSIPTSVEDSRLSTDQPPSVLHKENTNFSELASKIREALIFSLQQRLSMYDSEIRRLDSYRGTPQLDFRQLYLVKESLALMLQMIQLPAEALVQYEELEALLLSLLPAAATAHPLRLPDETTRWPMPPPVGTTTTAATTTGDCKGEASAARDMVIAGASIPPKGASDVSTVRVIIDAGTDTMIDYKEISDACDEGESVLFYSINGARMRVLRNEISTYELLRYLFARQSYFMCSLAASRGWGKRATADDILRIAQKGLVLARYLTAEISSRISLDLDIADTVKSEQHASLHTRRRCLDCWAVSATLTIARACNRLINFIIRREVVADSVSERQGGTVTGGALSYAAFLGIEISYDSSTCSSASPPSSVPSSDFGAADRLVEPQLCEHIAALVHFALTHAQAAGVPAAYLTMPKKQVSRAWSAYRRKAYAVVYAEPHSAWAYSEDNNKSASESEGISVLVASDLEICLSNYRVQLTRSFQDSSGASSVASVIVLYRYLIANYSANNCRRRTVWSLHASLIDILVSVGAYSAAVPLCSQLMTSYDYDSVCVTRTSAVETAVIYDHDNIDDEFCPCKCRASCPCVCLCKVENSSVRLSAEQLPIFFSVLRYDMLRVSLECAVRAAEPTLGLLATLQLLEPGMRRVHHYLQSRSRSGSDHPGPSALCAQLSHLLLALRCQPRSVEAKATVIKLVESPLFVFSFPENNQRHLRYNCDGEQPCVFQLGIRSNCPNSVNVESITLVFEKVGGGEVELLTASVGQILILHAEVGLGGFQRIELLFLPKTLGTFTAKHLSISLSSDIVFLYSFQAHNRAHHAPPLSIVVDIKDASLKLIAMSETSSNHGYMQRSDENPLRIELECEPVWNMVPDTSRSDSAEFMAQCRIRNVGTKEYQIHGFQISTASLTEGLTLSHWSPELQHLLTDPIDDVSKDLCDPTAGSANVTLYAGDEFVLLLAFKSRILVTKKLQSELIRGTFFYAPAGSLHRRRLSIDITPPSGGIFNASSTWSFNAVVVESSSAQVGRLCIFELHLSWSHKATECEEEAGSSTPILLQPLCTSEWLPVGRGAQTFVLHTVSTGEVNTTGQLKTLLPFTPVRHGLAQLPKIKISLGSKARADFTIQTQSEEGLTTMKVLSLDPASVHSTRTITIM